MRKLINNLLFVMSFSEILNINRLMIVKLQLLKNAVGRILLEKKLKLMELKFRFLVLKLPFLVVVLRYFIIKKTMKPMKITVNLNLSIMNLKVKLFHGLVIIVLFQLSINGLLTMEVQN